MPRDALLEWEGREYDHNPKSADWYWALGIIATAGTIAPVLFGDYLLAILVIVAAARSRSTPRRNRLCIASVSLRKGS